jgi:hypothetical protein
MQARASQPRRTRDFPQAPRLPADPRRVLSPYLTSRAALHARPHDAHSPYFTRTSSLRYIHARAPSRYSRTRSPLHSSTSSLRPHLQVIHLALGRSPVSASDAACREHTVRGLYPAVLFGAGGSQVKESVLMLVSNVEARMR